MSATRLALVLCTVVLVMGCRSGPGGKQDYSRSVGTLAYKNSGNLVVAVQDRRPYVVSGEKNGDYVGSAFGAYNMRINMVTKSAKPLTADIAASMEGTLKRAGYEVTKVEVPPTDGAAGAKKILADIPDRVAFLVVHHWKGEITQTGAASLTYHATMNVMKRGKVLASKTIQGVDDLGRSGFNPAGHAKKELPAALTRHLENMLNDAAVAKALK